MRPRLAILAVGFLGVLLVSFEAWAQTSSTRNSSSSNSRSSNQTIQSASDLMSKYAPSTGSNGLTNYAETMRGSDTFVGADIEDRGAFIGRGGNLDATDNGTAQSGSTRSGSSRYGNNSSRSRSGSNRNSQFGNNRNGQFGRNRTGQTTATFLPTVRLGFECAPPKDLSTQLTTRLQQTKHVSIPKSIHLDCKEGVAVLRGTVATDHERALAEQLVALEPGVRRVDNQITVAPPAAAAPAAP